MWLERDHLDQWLAAISVSPAEVVEGFDPRWFVIYQGPYGDPCCRGRERAASGAFGATRVRGTTPGLQLTTLPPCGEPRLFSSCCVDLG